MHYSPGSYLPQESVGFLLSQVKVAMSSFMEAELQSHGLELTAAQWVTLMRIDQGCARTAADLCRDVNYDTGSMTRLLDRLEDKGYIRRERSTEDRRVVQLALTEAGQALMPQLKQVGANMLNHYLRDFSADEVSALKTYLRRMLAAGA
jgi:MarR family transcriptional regulator, multiple antibiotic resistance protein MarR